MNNSLKIKVFQKLPFFFKQLRQILSPPKISFNNLVEDIDYFAKDIDKNKRALIALSPDAWFTAIKEYPNIRYFNVTGLTFEMVRVLNQQGYLVDIVSNQIEFIPTKKYDLYIGHGGKCQTTIEHLPKNTKIIQYVSGAYWKVFNKESEERYASFCKRKNVKEKLKFKRSLDGLIEGEEYLTRKANVLFTAYCPRMVEGYGDYKKKFFFTGLGAYLDPLFNIAPEEKDFDKGRKNFIYVGGTGGNIQKGMDIIIDAFAQTPQLNLYIYCNVEDEILKYCKKELNAKNIHYIYHYRFPLLRKKLKKLLKYINYTIHAPINTGTGTAFMASVGSGLIPVGYVDISDKYNASILTDDWSVDSLVDCINKAANMSPEWCEKASQRAKNYYLESWDVSNFRHKFTKLIQSI